MEADESMGEDARSIVYFDMYVTMLASVLISCPSRPRGLTDPKPFMQDSATGG